MATTKANQKHYHPFCAAMPSDTVLSRGVRVKNELGASMLVVKVVRQVAG